MYSCVGIHQYCLSKYQYPIYTLGQAPAMSVSDAAFLRSTRAAEAAAVRETRLREAISCRSVRGRIGGALGSATSSVADTLRGWLRM